MRALSFSFLPDPWSWGIGLKEMISIIDYGMGNLQSVRKALALLDTPVQIISDPDAVKRSDKIILPGVGAFGDAIAALRQSAMDAAIKDFVGSGRAFLGICLGMQLLVDVSFEDGQHTGLSIIPGRCVRLTVDQPPLNLKVPHMGWNALEFDPAHRAPLLDRLPEGAYMYFVHSYHVEPADGSVVAAVADYGVKLTAAVVKDNVMATQFHPEKSQAAGRTVLENFVRF